MKDDNTRAMPLIWFLRGSLHATPMILALKTPFTNAVYRPCVIQRGSHLKGDINNTYQDVLLQPRRSVDTHKKRKLNGPLIIHAIKFAFLHESSIKLIRARPVFFFVSLISSRVPWTSLDLQTTTLLCKKARLSDPGRVIDLSPACNHNVRWSCMQCD